jgi:hypothetical protein
LGLLAAYGVSDAWQIERELLERIAGHTWQRRRRRRADHRK